MKIEEHPDAPRGEQADDAVPGIEIIAIDDARRVRRDANPQGLAEAMAVTRPSGRTKLGILVRAIPLGRWSESKQRPAVAVSLRDPEANAAQPSQALVRRLFGLTRMEAQLALLLTEGCTLDEAAEKMNVRRNTARTHLRSIFCKTGVTGRPCSCTCCSTA
ncbi:MAG: hypothetical protein QM661_08195 [Solimonas sp.]